MSDPILNSDLFRESRLLKIDLENDILESTSYQYALRIVVALQEAGYIALLAGGCVRDFLRKTAPNDYDVATNATPEQVREVFGKKQTQFVGASFGVVCVHKRIDGQRHSVEVATFRTDGSYSDGRRPDSVEYSDPESDAQRRDFTINGLYCDPVTKTVIDFVEGTDDLGRGMIRCIGVARERIEEDRLRMLRAVRFATRFHFSVDSETCSAIREMAREITDVSSERIAIELRKMLTHGNRHEALALLDELKLLPHLWPGYESDFPDNEAVSRACERIEHIAFKVGASSNLAIDFATVVATVVFQTVHWHKNDSAGSLANKLIANKFQSAWRLSNDECRCISNAIAIANTILQSNILPNSIVQPALKARFSAAGMLIAKTICQLVECGKIQRVAVSCPIDFLSRQLSVVDSKSIADRFSDGPEDLIDVFGMDWVDCMSESITKCQSLLESNHFDPAPLINGGQLAKAGIRPGPNYSELLIEIRRRQLDGDLNTSTEAINFAVDFCSDD